MRDTHYISICHMSREQLLTLTYKDTQYLLSAKEFEHIATVFGALWKYDYGAANKGRVGTHALLKSGRHSDTFYYFAKLLKSKNIRLIIACQMLYRLTKTHIIAPDYVIGVPNGATLLAGSIAEILEKPQALMEKNADGGIILTTTIPPEAKILLVEDICTRGTGFTEAVREIKKKQPSVRILPYDPLIINRGGLGEILVKGVGTFKVVPIVQQMVNDWTKERCPICRKYNSMAVKPKVTDNDWQEFITSQLPK
ncbi:MAG: hypothetical protein MN733_43170 [Nitrososphaera sp.]|nr:hypothetical protein [Nitrososphaera sp.]